VSRIPSRIYLWLCVCIAGLASCTQPTPISPPQPGSPRISCPASLSFDTTAETSLVTYPAPVVSDGAPPVTTTCTRQSGSTFPVGTTPVICTAQDSQARSSQCAFDVKLTALPRLKGTRILAFGDSITCCEIAPAVTPQETDPAHSYPAVLQQLLAARYTSQSVQIVQQGQQGESVFSGEDRLVGAIDSTHPDILLLLEGTNDVNVAANTGADLQKIVQALRADVQRARNRGVPLVLLSTLLPQVPELCTPGQCRAANPEGVLDVNDGIRGIASQFGAVLVDMYAAFLPRKLTLIGNDGLHPTVEGTKVMAETFLAAISANYEQPLDPGPVAVPLPGPSSPQRRVSARPAR
jgi:lysophospholipase L1-like esterase